MTSLIRCSPHTARSHFPEGRRLRGGHNGGMMNLTHWNPPPPPPHQTGCRKCSKVFVAPPRRRHMVKAARRNVNDDVCSDRKTHTFKITFDIPFYEAPEASFDEYLEERPRLIRAISPYEKRLPERISEEEWRIYMAPIEFLFMSVAPVVHMRVRVTCKGQGVRYPSGVPPNTSKILELKAIKSELKGSMERLLKQTRFELGVEGVVYPFRKGMIKGSSSRMKGELVMSITFDPPSAFALIPQNFHNDAAQLILKSIGEKMERNVNEGLLADYIKFKKEKL